MKKTVLGIFERDKNADFVIEELNKEGYNTRDITPLMENRRDQIEFISDKRGNIIEGFLSGAGALAVFGGLAGFIAGLIVPDPGAFFIGVPIAIFLGLTGVLASVLSGAIAGALIGGIIGAVLGYMVSSEDAKLYREQIQRNSIFLAVPVDEIDEEKVKNLFKQNGAISVKAEGVEYLGTDYLIEREKVTYDEPYRWYPNHERQPLAYAGVKGGKSKVKEKPAEKELKIKEDTQSSQ